MNKYAQNLKLFFSIGQSITITMPYKINQLFDELPTIKNMVTKI